MRIAVVGASGNVGSALLRRLGDEPEVQSIRGIARRLPALDLRKVEWVAADIVDANL